MVKILAALSILNSGGTTKKVVTALGVRSAESRIVNVLEMKCLRSLVGVSRLDRVRNEEVHRRVGIEWKLASIAD